MTYLDPRQFTVYGVFEDADSSDLSKGKQVLYGDGQERVKLILYSKMVIKQLVENLLNFELFLSKMFLFLLNVWLMCV